MGVTVSLPVLSLSNVSKGFSGRRVLDCLELQLHQGECMALLGPNGAGKSTTISLSLGLASADAGEVRLLDYVLPGEAHLARAHVGVVPQYDALDPDFTVFENLLVFGRYFGLHGKLLRDRADSLLDFAHLRSRRDDSVTNLSGGMRRRLMLARALINQPRVLFLDEPTTGLDPQAKHEIWDRLMELKRQGMAMFLTTHYMDEAQRLSDQVAVLDHGKIMVCDTPQSLIRSEVGYAVLELWGEQANDCKARLLADAPEIDFEQRGEILYCRNAHADFVLAWMKAKQLAGVEYMYRPGNLEDVFFSLTGRGLRDG